MRYNGCWLVADGWWLVALICDVLMWDVRCVLCALCYQLCAISYMLSAISYQLYAMRYHLLYPMLYHIQARIVLNHRNLLA